MSDYTLTRWGERQAICYLDGFAELAGKLSYNPDMGTRYGLPYDDLLNFPYESHVLYYTKASHGITIVRVLHKRMKAHQHLPVTV